MKAIHQGSKESRDGAAFVSSFRIFDTYATGMAVDEETRLVLDRVIADYTDGTLDRPNVKGLEAAMRLSPCVARLVADRTEELR